MASSIQDKTIEPLIRAPEAAKILNIGISSVYRLAEAGLIPSISLGGSRRFRKSSLLAWMDEKERKSLSLAITGGIKK